MSQNYSLVRVKRDWVPEWMWSMAKPFVLWLWPLQKTLTVPTEEGNGAR